MIKAISRNGLVRALIYNKTVLMADRDDDLLFDLDIDNEQIHFKFKIQFTFSESGDKYTTFVRQLPNNEGVHWTLNKWNSAVYVEVSTPMKIKVKNKRGEDKELLVKFRNQSSDNRDKNQRKFNISIWLEE